MDGHGAVLKGILFAIASSLVASTAGAASKMIADVVQVTTIVLFQYGLCLLLLVPMFLRYPLSHWSTRRPGAHLLRGLAGWLCFYAYYLAIKHIPLVDAALLRNTAPLFVPLLIWGWMKVEIPKSHWQPLILGFIGVILILKPDLEGVETWHLIGLISGLSLALSMVGTRVLSNTEPASVILFYYYLISFLCSLPLAIMEWQAIPLWTLPYLLYIGFSISLTMWCYTRAYTLAKASIVAPINYSGVVFAGGLGWLIWGHIPGTVALAGIVLVVVAGLLSSWLGFSQNRSGETINNIPQATSK